MGENLKVDAYLTASLRGRLTFQSMGNAAFEASSSGSSDLTSMYLKVTCYWHLWAAIMAIAILPIRIVDAQTMEPLSYTNSPVGLNFLIAGYSYQSGSVLADPSLPIHDVEAKVDSATLAFSHILDCWDQSGSIALVMPYARLSA